MAITDILKNFFELPPEAYQYDYRVDSGGETYVARAIVGSMASILGSDIDEKVLGMQCDDPAFCMAP